MTEQDAVIQRRPPSLSSRLQAAGLVMPDFDRHGIANLAARLYRRNLPCPPLQHPALDGLETVRTVILLIIDGMGCAQLDAHSPHGWFRQHQTMTLTSVFPSATTSAISTYLTGMPPALHGLTGWHMAASEVNGIVTPLPLTMRVSSGEVLPQDALAARLFTASSGLDTLDRHTIALQPAYIIDSPYSRHHTGHAERIGWQNYDDLFARLGECLQAERRQFVYAYIPDLDALMHRRGTGHPRCQALIEELEQRCAAFAAMLMPHSARLLVCADHGQQDVPPSRMLALEDFPDLAASLQQPLSGEPRVAFCHVKASCRQQFPALAEQQLGHAAWCIPSQVLLDEGWFGPGPAHPRLAARIGDFTLLMKDDWGLLDTLEGERRPTLLGNHGGLSRAEMLVPLVVAPCP
jgi:hypothetical protein